MLMCSGGRFVFFGDSITEADPGYTRLLAAMVGVRHPDLAIDWVYRGAGSRAHMGCRERRHERCMAPARGERWRAARHVSHRVPGVAPPIALQRYSHRVPHAHGAGRGPELGCQPRAWPRRRSHWGGSTGRGSTCGRHAPSLSAHLGPSPPHPGRGPHEPPRQRPDGRHPVRRIAGTSRCRLGPRSLEGSRRQARALLPGLPARWSLGPPRLGALLHVGAGWPALVTHRSGRRAVPWRPPAFTATPGSGVRRIARCLAAKAGGVAPIGEPGGRRDGAETRAGSTKVSHAHTGCPCTAAPSGLGRHRVSLARASPGSRPGRPKQCRTLRCGPQSGGAGPVGPASSSGAGTPELGHRLAVHDRHVPQRSPASRERPKSWWRANRTSCARAAAPLHAVTLHAAHRSIRCAREAAWLRWGSCPRPITAAAKKSAPDPNGPALAASPDFGLVLRWRPSLPRNPRPISSAGSVTRRASSTWYKPRCVSKFRRRARIRSPGESRQRVAPRGPIWSIGATSPMWRATAARIGPAPTTAPARGDVFMGAAFATGPAIPLRHDGAYRPAQIAPASTACVRTRGHTGVSPEPELRPPRPVLQPTKSARRPCCP